ncbi:unnamed protein product [Cladocopium goreaui]|uniref:Uncharacterized protein n=1 Tax=Cladocopium goreaui TaxID=2562237 RepID=A0A9P1CMQ1_9DINO|nr:unnamed protein product [Cladocopium goreaui]
MAPKGRRGVLVTSSKQKKVFLEEDDEKLQSQREWEDLEREAKEIVRLRLASESGRPSAAYDDVAEANAEVIDKTVDGEVSTAASAAEKKEDSDSESEDKESVAVAPIASDAGTSMPETRGKRKRAGKKKSGAQKKREKMSREEGGDPRRQKEEDDDRWLKLRLAGEEKPRRIDANRIVSYYDFDGRGNPIRKPIGSVETAEDEEDFIPGDRVTTSSGGNFRGQLSQDLWAADSDESE